MLHAVLESFSPVKTMLIFGEQDRRHLNGMCAVANQALNRRAAGGKKKNDKGGTTE